MTLPKHLKHTLAARFSGHYLNSHRLNHCRQQGAAMAEYLPIIGISLLIAAGGWKLYGDQLRQQVGHVSGQ